jgi:hypothetical protein
MIMINAVPPRYSATELGIPITAPCLVCNSRSEGEAEHREWVLCPMLDQRSICLGCCLDYQGLARATDFETDPFRDLFVNLSQTTGKGVSQLRRICINHQREIVARRLSDPSEPDDVGELIVLASHLEQVETRLPHDGPEGERVPHSARNR